MQDTPTIHPLDGLIREILDLPEAERFDALASACQKLGGIVIRPGNASHMHEFSVLGSYARAADRQELVLNWLRSAQALHVAFTEFSDVADHKPPPADIEFHPAKRGSRVADAAAKIARADPCEREWASQLALVPGNGIPGRVCA